MQIGNNKVVTVMYSLYSSLPGGERVFVEETTDENQLTFLFGNGQLIPDFEDNLSGLTVGKTFDFSIDAENGYGMQDDEAIVKVGNDMFKVEGVLDLEVLQVGNTVPLLDKDGNQMVAKILGIDGETVILDFNHPLAGQNLHFSGSVTEVREATAEEISHGHAHHAGMHDH
jgi:FKBP-type peptidyl-prolyl cis-trans isomerase SlyD